jgi:DNA-binding winged helix-turn-helix (wHTH) protein
MAVVFGECEFDSGQRVLLRHGNAAPLSTKAFQLLQLLLDRRPEAVAKTELLQCLWPESFVSDASLHNLVAEVRAAIGDSPRAARYIRTVPRYGYAFHGDVRPAAPVVLSTGVSGPRLVSTHGEWLLPEGSNLVGRDRDCAVRVNSAALSRRHARIVVTSAGAAVEDLGSKNGTRVNGRRVTQPVALEENDRVQFGSVTMRYRTLDTLPSTVTRRGGSAK